jgi:hypothetical protein
LAALLYNPFYIPLKYNKKPRGARFFFINPTLPGRNRGYIMKIGLKKEEEENETIKKETLWRAIRGSADRVVGGSV